MDERKEKLMVMLVNGVASILLYFGSKYLGASFYADIKFLIGILQPMVLLYLGLETYRQVRVDGNELTVLRAALAKKVDKNG